MTRWAIAVLLIGGATLFLIGFNARLWRRYKTTVQARIDYGAADFDRDCAARGVDPAVPPVVRMALAPWYPDDLVPQPDDSFDRYLGADPEDVEEIVADCRRLLALPKPDRTHPEPVPELQTVGELAQYLSVRRAEMGAPATPQEQSS